MTCEPERGTIERLLSTPVRPIEVMIGKLARNVAVSVFQATLIITLERLLFGVTLVGGCLPLIVGVLLFIIGSHLDGGPHPAAGNADVDALFPAVDPAVWVPGGMAEWAQWLGSLPPVTYMLRVALVPALKGVGVMDAVPRLVALASFVLAMVALAVRQYWTTLD